MSKPINHKLNGSLEQLTADLLASYEAGESTRRIGEAFLPSHDRIIEIIEQTRQLLFPGFFGSKGLTRENVRYHVGNLLVRLGGEVAEQINHCLCIDRHENGGDGASDCLERAEHIAGQWLAMMPSIREALALDAQAAYDGDPAAKSISEIVYCYPGFYAVTVYRIAHALVELGVPLMPRIMSEHAHSLTGCDIHPGAKIGRSFFIDHATGVVIGETTHIGDNVKMYQGVTLGALSFPKDERGRVIKGLQRHPTIEDNVTIYANATILGGLTVIGARSTIGGNISVTRTIPPDSVVLQGQAELQVKSKRHSS